MTELPSQEIKNINESVINRKDAFSVMPIIFGFALYIVEIVLGFEPNLNILGTLFLIGVLILCAYRVFMHISYGFYKSAISLILAIMLLYFPVKHFGEVSENIRITLNEKQYFEEINLNQPDENGFRYKEFNWGHDFFWNEFVLIYDESDEWGLPEISRSEVWWAKVGGHNGTYFYCSYGVQKRKSHFYTVGYHCG